LFHQTTDFQIFFFFSAPLSSSTPNNPPRVLEPFDTDFDKSDGSEVELEEDWLDDDQDTPSVVVPTFKKSAMALAKEVRALAPLEPVTKLFS
jgi:hypothetical protein